MSVSEGMDVARIRDIARRLQTEAERITTVAQTGHQSLSTLVGAWEGGDSERFVGDWEVAGRRCQEAAQSLHTFGSALIAQADDQHEGSSGSGAPVRGGGGGGDGVGSGNPDITDDQKGDSTYQDLDGPLVDEDGIEPDDVKQGALGDCWLISSMRGIAGTPEGAEMLADNITDNGDGTYDVTLYRDGEPVVVTVTGEVPVGPDGEPVYANNDTSDRELWPLLFEKAMAQEFGGDYHDLDGDWPAKAIEAMTGNDVQTYDEGFLPWDDKDFPDAASMHDQLEDGGVMVASTNGDGEKSSDGELVSNHAYTVTDVDPDTGEVTVQNPWGAGYPPITMSHAEFEERFARLDVGTTK